MNRLRAAVLAVTVSAAGMASGCVTSAGVSGEVVYGYPVVTVDTVPDYVYYSPRVLYRGRYAYLVQDRWYYPSSRGWVVFRQEPDELRRHRVYYRTHRSFPTYARPTPVYREPARPRYYERPPAYRPDERPRYREPAYGTPRTQRRYYR